MIYKEEEVLLIHQIAHVERIKTYTSITFLLVANYFLMQEILYLINYY